MSILPLSPSDLINIARTPSSPLQNCVDTGTGFDIILAGNDNKNWSGVPQATENFRSGMFEGDNYIVSADINWLGAIILIPDNAIITSINLRARISYEILASANNTPTPPTQTNAYVRARIIASIEAPNTALVPGTDDSISETDIDEDATPGASVSVSANEIQLGSIFLRKLWSNLSLTKAQLETQFTEIQIILLSTEALSLLSASGSDNATGAVVAEVEVNVTDWAMTVDYVPSYSWTINPPEMSAVQAGDLITITSSGVNALALDQLAVDMGGPITPITQTPNTITFNVPPGLPPGPIPIIVTGGTQFSGSLPLGVLEIIGADVSGIYVLENGKTSDSLYNSSRDGSVAERAIPNPFIESGFVGG